MLKSKKAGAGDSAQRHNIPSIVIVGILAFLGILLACFIHVRLIRDNLKDVISDQYGSQLQVAEKAMGDRMKDIEGNIDNASAEIELKMQKKCSDSQITQVLAKYATSDDITNLIFIDRDGIALLDSGEAKDVSSYYDELNAAKDRRFFVSKRGIYGEDGYSLVYLSPVVVNGETEGMVVATQDCKHMIESDAFANMKRIGNIYMLDQDAHILASSYPVDDIHGDYDTIYDFSSAMYHLTNKSVLTMEAALENTATDEETVVCQDKDGNNFSYDEAVHRLILREELAEQERNVLVSHQFYLSTGKDDTIERSASELVTVGNIDSVQGDILNRFDYAALGHIHKAQRLNGRDCCRYCGTPLACSFSEEGQQKGVIEVELGAKGEVTTTVLPLVPLRQVRTIKDTLANVLAQPSGDYVSITLTDADDYLAGDTRDRLMACFPHLLHVGRENRAQADYPLEREMAVQLSPFDLCRDFLQDMDAEEETLLASVINEVQEAGK